MFGKKLNYWVINSAFLMMLLYFAFSNITLWWGVLTKTLQVLTPFIVGFAFAYAFTPVVKYLQSKGLSKSLSILIVVIGVVLIIAGLMAVTLPMLYDQLALFIKMISKVIKNINTRFHINIGSFEIQITDYLNSLLKELGTVTSSTTVDIVNKSLNFISKFIVGFVAFVYYLADMEKIRKALKDLLKTSNKRFYEYTRLMDIEISNYLQGLEIFMIIQLFEYSILFFIIGHPNWLILGLLACITTVIPYFGGLITNLIAIVLASVVSIPLTIATVIICLIFPQLDGYLISPRVYGKTNNVNPLITIMAVSIGGTVANVIGIIIALPCYLLLRTTYIFFKGDLKKGMSMMKETM